MARGVVRLILVSRELATETHVVMEGGQLMVAAIVTQGGQERAVKEVGTQNQ